MFIVYCVFYWEFLWIWVAERVGEVFSGFDGKACGFPASDGNIRIVWLGFAGREMARLVA